MEARQDHTKKKGGRSKKAVKQDQQLGVHCSLIERKAIEAQARSVNLTVSSYLRRMGLEGNIGRTEIALPGEVLQLIGTLNQLAAKMNQIACKRNRQDELNALERATLQHDSSTLRQLAKDIKNYFE